MQHLDGPPKTDAGHRSIPLPSWLCEALASDLDRVGIVKRNDYLILNQHGRPINRDTFRAKIVRPALRKAGLPDVFRTYDLRHTHASLLIDAGANVLALSERMGHADPAITLRVTATCSRVPSRSSPTDSTNVGGPGRSSRRSHPAVAVGSSPETPLLGRGGAAVGREKGVNRGPQRMTEDQRNRL